ncbi:hypothetical protein MTYM_00811 [Methylococcales bacterium]|nr:hypothetical protein MTYM_00811 [Methylococcales bacterium]
MKELYKTTIFLFAVLSTAFANPVFAESGENTKTNISESIGDDHEIEFYDYHSGMTYSYSLFNFVYRHLDKNVMEHDKKHTESTQR